MSKVLGKGRAEAITPAHMAALADEIGCHPAHLEAIAKVESQGFGWFKDGRIKILFEKHWFYKKLRGAQRDKAVRQRLARKTWVSPKRGGYKDQNSPDDRYGLLSKAIKINRNAALQSASIGTYQIMGFNWEVCGFSSVEDMWEQFLDSEANQLRAFGNFLIRKGLRKALIEGDFDRVEEVYNGGGLNGAYAKRMRRHAAALKRTKWAAYKPGSMDVPKPVSKPAAEVPQKPVQTNDGVKAAGSAVAAILGGLAAFWHNGGFVLLSAIGIVAAGYFAIRMIKNRSK